MITFFFRDRIVATATPWMAASDSFDCQITAIKYAMNLQSFISIARAGRFKAARGWCKWRNGDLVKSD